MIGKGLTKQNYLENKNFIAASIWKILQMQIKCTQKEFVKTFKYKKLGMYHDFYLKSGTYISANVFENFKKKLKICV